MRIAGIAGLIIFATASPSAAQETARKPGISVEAGRRVPGIKRFTSHSKYYLSNPDAPGDPRQAVEVESTTDVKETSVADVAMLLRFASLPGRRFELAALAGLDVHHVKVEWHTTIPRSLTDPGDVDAFSSSKLRRRAVFDLGLEGGVALNERWALLVYGIAGLQSPLEESRREQLRAGVILRRRF